MKYPDLWEKAEKIAEKIKLELMPTLPIKTTKHQSLVLQAISGGHFNTSIKMMAYTELQNGLSEEDIYDLAKRRAKNYFVFIRQVHKSKTKKQEDLEFYKKIQKELGNT